MPNTHSRRSVFLALAGILVLQGCQSLFGPLVRDRESARVSFMLVEVPFEGQEPETTFSLRNVFQFGTGYTSRYTGHRSDVSAQKPLVMSGVVGDMARITRAFTPLGLCERGMGGHGVFAWQQDLHFSLSNSRGRRADATLMRLEDGGIQLRQNFVPNLPTEMIFDLPRGESIVLAFIRDSRLELLIIGLDVNW